MKSHILVVDDDARLRSLLSKYLRDHGFTISTAENGAVAVDLVSLLKFDLMIVDVMMPEMNGFDFTKNVRKNNDTPILLLTAMGEIDDRINGLECGADDYLVKPFEPKELLLRINSILKRAAKGNAGELLPSSEIKMGNCLYDVRHGELYIDGARVHLSPSESMLLNVLATSVGKIFSREDLGNMIGNDGNLRTIDVQITRLRRKIESDQKNPKYIRTVRGQGYCLCPD